MTPEEREPQREPDRPVEPGEASELSSETEALQRERDELFARLQRVSADYANYIKRSTQNLSDGIEFAKGDLMRQLIPVLDHFENALGVEPASDDAKALRDGVKIVRDELLKALQMAGVEKIDANVGDAFDPTIHEAMLHQPAEGVKANGVSMVFSPGYRFGKRTLRPAKVAVAPAPGSENAEA
ncbi:MAG: nucleotide exchange factor GrpE [Phycisphaerales bacterium]